jgi:hypothetical protein
MAKKLYVVIRDSEYREIQRMARSRRMSMAEWVRQALELACRRDPLSETGKKLDTIRAAARYEFPTVDINVLLAEIESGYNAGPHS